MSARCARLAPILTGLLKHLAPPVHRIPQLFSREALDLNPVDVCLGILGSTAQNVQRVPPVNSKDHLAALLAPSAPLGNILGHTALLASIAPHTQRLCTARAQH